MEDFRAIRRVANTELKNKINRRLRNKWIFYFPETSFFNSSIILYRTRNYNKKS